MSTIEQERPAITSLDEDIEDTGYSPAHMAAMEVFENGTYSKEIINEAFSKAILVATSPEETALIRNHWAIAIEWISRDDRTATDRIHDLSTAIETVDKAIHTLKNGSSSHTHELAETLSTKNELEHTLLGALALAPYTYPSPEPHRFPEDTSTMLEPAETIESSEAPSTTDLPHAA